MKYAAVSAIGMNGSILVPRPLRIIAGLENGSTVYFQLVESSFYQITEAVNNIVEMRELWCFVASIDPDCWNRLFNVEMRLGDELGSLAKVTEILVENGISLVSGDFHTCLRQVRASAYLTLWFEKFSGGIDDLNRVFEEAIRKDSSLRRFIKPIGMTADREIWIQGSPSKLTNYVFSREFAPGIAGKPGKDVPLALPLRQRFSTILNERVIIPEAVIERVDKIFGLPNERYNSIAGSSYVVMEANSETKSLALTFLPPEAHLVTIEFLTSDRPDSISAIVKVLSNEGVRLIQMRARPLSFREEGLLTIVADIKDTKYKKIFPHASVVQKMMKDIRARIPDADKIVKQVRIRLYPTTPKTAEVPFLMLSGLEAKIRFIIEKELHEAFGPDWFKKCVPQDVALKVKERKASELRQFIEPRHDIEYLDFADHIKIITNKKNWLMAFRDIFPDKGWLKTRLSVLISIRNKIIHAPEQITDSEFQKLKLFHKEISNVTDNLR